MLNKFRLPILALGTALTLLSPMAAFARHHERVWQEREAREWEWREHHPRFRVYVGPARPYGYYDRWGYYRPYANGWYDRWGYFHPY